jgi:nucleoside-diphosphate-sugar epimerase
VRILVTGAAGFIGAHLCRELAGRVDYLAGFDVKPNTEWPEAIHYNLDGLTYGIDLLDGVDDALERHEPDVVIHLAAKVGRLFGEDDVVETVADNAALTALVAKSCGERGVRMVYASTSEIYGDCGPTVAYEGMTPRLPHNAYGLSKRHGEEFCRLYASENLIIWRISMPYGPGLPAGRGRAAIVNMLWQADNRQPIPVHRGSERSWCWIGDTVRAMRLTLEQPDGGVFNVGRDDASVSMRRVAELACDLTGAPYELIEEVDAPLRQTVVKRLATNKVRALGWEPEVDLEEGMALTLEWVREQMQAEQVAA